MEAFDLRDERHFCCSFTGRVTTKVDVFSFGVILIELISGRKALDETQPEESLHLVTCIRTVSELACHCRAREPYRRPDMDHVINVLSSLVKLWKPAQPVSDDIYGIDLKLTLPQALKKWQALENSNLNDSSSFLASADTTQTSIPGLSTGFADSFRSADARWK
ncbi:hypothetical protein V6N13_099175 [Hibiscus sabdariffa]